MQALEGATLWLLYAKSGEEDDSAYDSALSDQACGDTMHHDRPGARSLELLFASIIRAAKYTTRNCWMAANDSLGECARNCL